ncbi:NAD-dependent protein deacetylase sirtuin-2 [Entophlyctis luteolus]|nr:NAD-dependent protein deacetylase sirtuin-2 [Entophlyctis luteolus]
MDSDDSLKSFFAVHPKLDCPHVHLLDPASPSSAEASTLRDAARSAPCEVLECASTSENWVCLRCFHVACSRYVNGHMAVHVQSVHNGMCVAVSMADLSVYCYECDEYIQTLNKTVLNALNILHKTKFDGAPHVFASSALETQEKKSSNSILKDSTIESFAEYVKENNCRKIVVLTGAGLSTSAGIPDFRSPGTGLYYNLEKYRLPSPDQPITSSNRINPKPFFVLAKELYPGNFCPTLSHYFIKMLAKKNMLLRNFTQNIDTLERIAKIDDELLVEAHGSFSSASCVGGLQQIVADDGEVSVVHHSPCGAKFSQEWVKIRVFADEIPKCPACEHGIVKPDITFFGEAMPARFRERVFDLEEADAVIVMGSSLKVFPFASLPALAPKKVPRLLINREIVGDFDQTDLKGKGPAVDHTESTGEPPVRDAIYLGTCDDGCLLLAELLGFKQELEQLYANERASFLANKQREPDDEDLLKSFSSLNV